ncbi:PqiC family protein [Thiorhodovibrio frisius]|uniref:ABC-type transport auxiliary lipoprotein component domain-containing protein n=1 Tax=Thiorhodovibrio frisius TaxID=631362 RepID=H8Z2C8_9GAMM|nr:PqiC family protein [Thiorhodovibrio frisius]EIC21583.1 hypothetical protein Thi970DRAFT_01798 [Thiorhodovibrio frisius]WPL21549.1 ABC-type uncharacterized transport system, auxiliary component [Thiorhodovibrio frisius]
MARQIAPVICILVIGTAAAVLAGCASPTARFYTLSATTSTVAPASSLSLSVGPVSVPAAVDRPQMVVTLGPNQVSLQEFDRWASPLKDEISRTVAENLVALLRTPHVTQFPGSSSAEADYRVSIEVQRFDSTPGEAATLDAVWTLRRIKDGQSKTGRTSTREPVNQPGYDELAAAHSRALARLSQDIADAVQAPTTK